MRIYASSVQATAVQTKRKRKELKTFKGGSHSIVNRPVEYLCTYYMDTRVIKCYYRTIGTGKYQYNCMHIAHFCFNEPCENIFFDQQLIISQK